MIFRLLCVAAVNVYAGMIYNEGFALDSSVSSSLAQVEWAVYDASGTDWSSQTSSPSVIIQDGKAPDYDGWRTYMGGGSSQAMVMLAAAPGISSVQRDSQLTFSFQHRDADSDGSSALRFMAKVNGQWYVSAPIAAYHSTVYSDFKQEAISVESTTWYAWEPDVTDGFSLSSISGSGGALASGDITAVGLLLTNTQGVDAYRIDAFAVNGKVPLSAMSICELPVQTNGQSSALGYYGTSPESPDGEQLAFVTFNEAEGVAGTVWVCDRNDFSDLRAVLDIDSNAHNGAEVLWMSNTVLACQAESNGEIKVVDTDTDTVLLSQLYGAISHNSVNGKLAFAVNPRERNSWWNELGQTMERGIYLWDISTGTTSLVCSAATLSSTLNSVGATDLVAEPVIYHLQFSPDGEKLMLRWDGQTDPHMAVLALDGTLVSAYPDPKPLHSLWYDTNTIMGVETYSTSSLKGDFKRWALDGTEIETLAGVVTHGAASPDRQWFAGETANYFQSPIPFVLFEKGSTAQSQKLWQHAFDGMVWTNEYHVNPSFSQDGSRVYFNIAVSSNVSRAAYTAVSATDWVAASDEANGNIALNTADGILSSYWSTGTVGAWVRYDLGCVQDVSTVTVAWKYNNRYLFEIEVSNSEAGPWTSVYSGTSAGTGDVFEQYDFSGTTARFVRLIVNGRTGSSWSHVSEVMIF